MFTSTDTTYTENLTSFNTLHEVIIDCLVLIDRWFESFVFYGSPLIIHYDVGLELVCLPQLISNICADSNCINETSVST
jgi:hypothetical protein